MSEQDRKLGGGGAWSVPGIRVTWELRGAQGLSGTCLYGFLLTVGKVLLRPVLLKPYVLRNPVGSWWKQTLMEQVRVGRELASEGVAVGP